MINELFVGIDVAKAWLEVAWLPGETSQHVTYDEAGITGLLERLIPEKPTLVVLEATGGLETQVASRLAAAGLAVAVVNPGRYAITPKPAVAWPRLTGSTPSSWPPLLGLSGRRRDR